MTQCPGIPAEEMAERYLAGGLTEGEAEQFENHYFACESCHEYLIALQEIRKELALQPIAIAEPASGKLARDRSISGRLLAFPVPLAVLGSIAAALIFGAVLVGVQKSGYIVPPNPGGNSTAKVARPAAVPRVSQASASGENKPSAKTGDATGSE